MNSTLVKQITDLNVRKQKIPKLKVNGHFTLSETNLQEGHELGAIERYSVTESIENDEADL